MPPPPTAMTMKPPSTSDLIWAVSTMRSGRGLATRGQLVEQRLAEDVADTTLRIGHAHLQGERRHRGGVPDQLRPQEDEADLRPVAVRQHDAPAFLDERGDVARRLAGVLVLLLDRALLAVEDEGVAADG